MDDFRVLSGATGPEIERRHLMAARLRDSPVPDAELQMNLGLYTSRMQLSRMLLMNQLYRLIISVPGVVMEFGVRWGQNMALFANFRGMYEPYNYNRRIIGFDTFCGFPAVGDNDGQAVAAGDYGVAENYAPYLSGLLEQHDADSPVAHKKKFELVVGDATVTIHDYLKRQPETIVALAYFDFDVYQPTKACLEAILPRLTRGSVLVFDELNCPEFPGETLAVMETIGLSSLSLRRDPHNPMVSWAVIE